MSGEFPGDKMRWTVLFAIAVLVLTYNAIGGVIFHYLEYDTEQYTKSVTGEYVEQFFVNNTCLSAEDLDLLLAHLLDAYKQGINVRFNNTNVIDKSKWDILSAIFFATTVITTIGYGHLAPVTSGGKKFTIFYAMFGIPLCLLLLAGLATKFASCAQSIGDRVDYCRNNPKAGKGIVLLIIIISGTVLFIVVPSFVFTVFEGWSYIDSVYYSFITLYTIGFGDLIIGSNPHIRNDVLYNLGSIVWLFSGLAWLSTVITSMQLFIRVCFHWDETRNIKNIRIQNQGLQHRLERSISEDFKTSDTTTFWNAYKEKDGERTCTCHCQERY